MTRMGRRRLRLMSIKRAKTARRSLKKSKSTVTMRTM